VTGKEKPMRRRAKPAKAKVASKPDVGRTSPRDDLRVRDLEKRLAEALGREAEALEQQVATAAVLQTIRNSPSDVQPVFETILRRAVELCGALNGSLFQFDGELMHAAAHHNLPPEALEILAQEFPSPPSPGTVSGRTILGRCVTAIEDVLSDASYKSSAVRAGGFRSLLGVPLLSNGNSIGAIVIVRSHPGSFSDKQIWLLQTFADQAVIAIENVRLFKELEARNHALTESLDQQTATSEILRVISSSPTDTQPVFDAIAESAARLCSANDAQVLRVDGDTLRLVAECGATSMPSVRQLTRGHLVGRAVIDRQTIHVQDLAQALAEYPETTAARYGVQSALAVPLLHEGVALGVIRISRTEIRPFTDKQIALLQTFADQAVIAIENVRLFKETKESLERQTATSDILRVISSSPTDVRPVFDALAESAARLCDAVDAVIARVDGDRLWFVAHHGPIPAGLVGAARPFTRGSVAGRAVLEGRVVHVADLQAEVDEFPEGFELARRLGHRTTLSVPLIRDDVALGVITLRRTENRPFAEGQIALLKTFADQAVIAIENVRLFTELQASNRELTTALDQQTATSDILRVISQSQTDVQPVFDAIVQSAVRLLGAHSGALTQIAGDQITLAALTSTNDAGDDAARALFPAPLQSAQGMHAQAIRDRAPFNVADAETDPRFSEAGHAVARSCGYRSQVAVPLLRHSEAIGALAVNRREPGGFTDDEIALLQTFADQAVIAVENVRLFTELQARNRDLTATSEVLQVISRSPTDVQPVFDAIVRSAVRCFPVH